MKLWLITTTKSVDYDEYDSFVVASVDERTAKTYEPSYENMITEHYSRWSYVTNQWVDTRNHKPKFVDWPGPNYTKAICIGETDLEEGTIVISSFNAG